MSKKFVASWEAQHAAWFRDSRGQHVRRFEGDVCRVDCQSRKGLDAHLRGSKRCKKKRRRAAAEKAEKAERVDGADRTAGKTAGTAGIGESNAGNNSAAAAAAGGGGGGGGGAGGGDGASAGAGPGGRPAAPAQHPVSSALAVVPTACPMLPSEAKSNARQDDIKQVVAALTDPTPNTTARFALVGMGGIGKTALAAMVARDNAVRRHFDRLLFIAVVRCRQCGRAA